MKKERYFRFTGEGNAEERSIFTKGKLYKLKRLVEKNGSNCYIFETDNKVEYGMYTIKYSFKEEVYNYFEFTGESTILERNFTKGRAYLQISDRTDCLELLDDNGNYYAVKDKERFRKLPELRGLRKEETQAVGELNRVRKIIEETEKVLYNG